MPIPSLGQCSPSVPGREIGAPLSEYIISDMQMRQKFLKRTHPNSKGVPVIPKRQYGASVFIHMQKICVYRDAEGREVAYAWKAMLSVVFDYPSLGKI